LQIEVASPPLPFVAVTPCRIADTRGNGFTDQAGPPALAANVTRNFQITGIVPGVPSQCGIPSGVSAVSFNFAVTNITANGNLIAFPADTLPPTVSSLNWQTGFVALSNAAAVRLSSGGALAVQVNAASGTTVDLIIDVNGYYGGDIVNSLNGQIGAVNLVGVNGVTITRGSGTVTVGTTATPSSMADTIVSRDGTGSFSAETVTLAGNLVLPYPWTQTAGTIFQGSTRLLYTLGPSSGSVFLGRSAGNFMINGTGNTAVGEFALFRDINGGGNTAVGTASLESNTNGNFNTAVGYGAFATNTVGSSNTALGAAALAFIQGSGNIGIGSSAGGGLTTGSNNIDIFDQGQAGESNTIRIGTQGTQTTTYIAGISDAQVSGTLVVVDSNGQLGVAPSSRRFKEYIREIGGESEGLLKLRPVSFRYKLELDPGGLEQYGLVAEEVEQVYPELVTCDNAGEAQTVRYHLLVPLLLNEVQKDRKEIQDLRVRLERLEALARRPAS